MSNPLHKATSDIFIVDNTDEPWKVAQYLYGWTHTSRAFDIATGYFEIGALLELDSAWQNLDKIRILMGDEVSKRTQQAFEQALRLIERKLDDSLEDSKEENDFLRGVPAIVEAIRSGKIETRVYRKKKFHAKAYITHSRQTEVKSAALVGSSNFTLPGLKQNIELNIYIQHEVDRLQAWYEEHWNEAEDVTLDILKVIERHIHEYTPFDVYARSMVAYFQNHQQSVSEWEHSESKIFPILDEYQQQAYYSLMQIAHRYSGALLCDGVGLGKTFVGLMVIERLLFERKRVALFVPKSARADVWEAKLKRYLPEASGLFSNLVIFNHTDLLREGEYIGHMEEIAAKVDAIIVDEAHHFRNVGSSRARKFFEITQNKQVFLLTATPVNNSLYDLMHLIEYFSRGVPGYFSEAPLGIHTLRGHFRKMEEALKLLVDGKPSEIELDIPAAEKVLADDDLFRALVVQRSRAYVRQSLANQGGRDAAFPQRLDPQVGAYSLQKTYGRLLEQFSATFNRDAPLLKLALYNPIAYSRRNPSEDDQVTAFERGRQGQIVGLVRTLLLKRFESSPVAFESSCEDLLLKLLYFLRLHDEKQAAQWERHHVNLLTHLKQKRHLIPIDETELEDDIIPEELKKRFEKLDPKQVRVSDIVSDTAYDLIELARFLEEMRHLTPAHDDKLQTLMNLLQTDPILSQHKVIIFTEYRDTARYLQEQLQTAGIGPLAEVDSQSRSGLSYAVKAFSPYYNESSSAQLTEEGIQEIRVLIATDILAEGLNLQDATCLINYDLHWNPVRLMQRMGRVDRRLDPATEHHLIMDHPEVAAIRGTARIWNFLPPQELNGILSLYQTVAHKTLRISKTFGIEGRKLLTPQDDYEALREFNQSYEGKTTDKEEMYLAYQQLLKEYPDLAQQAEALPRRIFSGKISPDARGVFFCYRLPAKDAATSDWSDAASFTRWYLYYLDDGRIEEDATRIYPHILSTPETPRQIREEESLLADIRRKMDKHIANTYLKRIQAPVGVGASLLAWMELV